MGKWEIVKSLTACLLLALGMMGCSVHQKPPKQFVQSGHCPKDDSLPVRYTLRGELRNEDGKVLRMASVTAAICPGQQLMVTTYGPGQPIEFYSDWALPPIQEGIQ